MAASRRYYADVINVISRPSERRRPHELLQLAEWFKKKSKVLSGIVKETLLDVIQHCEFVTCQPDDVIIHQGEKGHRFYIVLRGTVSVLHKDALEDVDMGEEGCPRFIDRSTLGNVLVTLGEGTTFGEIALINPDCIRTASVVANDRTDLVVIHRDLYDRSVARVLARDFEERTRFVDAHPLTSSWAPRWRRALAASIKKETLAFDTPLFRQGDSADNMYFILSGEIKLTVDPEAHYQQFGKYMSCCREILDDDTFLCCFDVSVRYIYDLNESNTFFDETEREKAYFPTKLMPQLRKFSRIKKTSALSRPGSGGDRTIQLPRSWTPSSIRKMNARIAVKRVNLSMCYLGGSQYIGDVEFLLSLDRYHASAVCSQATTAMVLHRVHFERLFRRRNAQTVSQMARTAELQLARRALRPHILSSVPLFKCFIYRLQQMSGPRKPFVIPEMTYVARAHQKSSRGSSRSAPVVAESIATMKIRPPHYAYETNSAPTIASLSLTGSPSIVDPTEDTARQLEAGLQRLSPYANPPRPASAQLPLRSRSSSTCVS